MINYSQNQQQHYILDYFAKTKIKPKIIDLAAYDGIKFSNTYALLQQGAYNLAVQASPSVLPKLINNYKHLLNTQYSIYPYAITNHNGQITWYQSAGDAISSASKQHTNKWNNVKFNAITVQCRTLQTMLEEYGTNFQFLNLDVESNNYDIFKQVPNELWNNLQLVCVQYDGHKLQMQIILKAKGFAHIHTNGQNIIWGRP